MAHDKKEEITKELVPTEEDKPLATTATRFSSIPGSHKWDEMKWKSYEKAVDAEESCMRSLIDHTKTKDRLRNIADDIDTERAERQKNLLRAKRELDEERSLGAKTTRIQELELELEELELQAKIDKLKKKKNNQDEAGDDNIQDADYEIYEK